MTTTTDQAALYAAILADPEDDTVRLAFADWCDENGESDRAEFIRVQVALSRWSCDFKQTKEQPGWRHDCGTDDNGYWLCQPLRFREDALLQRHRADWLRVECPKCGGSGSKMHGEGSSMPFPCPDCTGGDAGGLTRQAPTDSHGGRAFVNPTTFARGFPAVVGGCRLADVMERRCKICGSDERETGTRGGGCARCDGGIVRDWQPTPWALAVFRNHPVQCVPLVCRDVGGAACSWLRDNDVRESYSLPAVLFDAVYSLHKHSQRDGDWLYYPTPEAANAALGTATADWIRDAVAKKR